MVKKPYICGGTELYMPECGGEPKIVGADNTSVKQGLGFDLMAGVKAYDADGNEIPFTVNPTELNKCDLGHQSFTYSAEGVTKVRTITVTEIADPTISGLTPLEVEVGEEFDPLAGVSAVDGNGNEVEVTYEEPVQHITLVDVANYTAPNSEHTPTINPWVWEGGNDVYMEGVLADGVPVTMDRWYTENDTHFCMVFSGFEVALRVDDDSYFISELRGINPPNEVTFERLIIKYLIEE